jgi:hypothetical protein
VPVKVTAVPGGALDGDAEVITGGGSGAGCGGACCSAVTVSLWPALT